MERSRTYICRVPGKIVRGIVVGVVLLLCLLLPAWSQQRTGELAGVVKDPSGAVVADATVTAIATSGAPRATKTNAQGAFSFPGLTPGAYTIVAEAPGFAATRRTGVEVASGRKATINLTLALATANAQVEVEAQPVEVAVSPTENASSVSVKGSDLQALADDPDALAEQIQELAGPSAGPNGPEIYVDGFSGADLPPKSAIREIKVNQNPFSAAYDRLGYGRVEILTKPGSEKLHGSGFVQGNSSAFNTPSPFLHGISQPPYHTLLYGGQVGGPLGKNASFFLGLERRNINRNNVVNTETLGSNGQPAPYVAAVSNPRTLTSITPRMDYQLSTNNTLSARYHFFGIDENNDGIGTQSLPSQEYSFSRQHHLLQVSDTQMISPKLINEVRFEYLHFHDVRDPQDLSPTLNVQGAFTGGGYSGGAWNRHETHYEGQDLVTMTLPRHYLQFGVMMRAIDRTEALTNGFNGTFIFNSLADYATTQQDLAAGMMMGQIQAAGVGPSQFNVTTGNPVASVLRLDGATWAQDDWKVRPNLTFSYGLRFESENVIGDHADWAPRVGISYGLGHGDHVKTVLRAGWGIFYDRFDDDEMITAAHENGTNQLSYVVANPSFFPALPSAAALAGLPASAPTVYRIAPNLKSPYAMETAASIEREVANNVTVSVTYLNSRGNRQFLTNDINAPLPGTYNPANPASGVRPLGPGTGNIYEYISQGIFRQNQVITNFRVKKSWVSLFGYYTFSDVHADANGVNSFPENPWNLMADYGRADFAVRHRVFVGGSLALPYAIQLYPMFVARSGWPYSITLGEDLFGTGIHNGRPSYATASTPAADVRVTPYGTFDINPTPAAGLIPPNTATGPSAYAFNLRVSRTFGFGGSGGGNHGDEGGSGDHGHWHRGGLGGRGLSGGGGGFGDGGGTERKYAITLTAEVQNVLNHVNRGIPVSNLNSPLFGQSLYLAGGPYSGGSDAVRRIDLRMSFSF